MDKFWSICSMPLGVFACFSPVILAWILVGTKRAPQNEIPKSDKH